MKKRIFTLILIEVIVVLVLTAVYEFMIEDFMFGYFKEGYESESLIERMEYIITTMIFIFIALIFPVTIIVRDSTKREQTLNKLQRALIDIKKLQGLLPICANCKKIRDDDGYWHQVEVYIKERSEAEFSHGLCPDCMKELYGELF
jgi:hypothetical protein